MTITAEDLVRREVHYCVSSLVSTLATGGGMSTGYSRELADLAEQAAELAAPIDDWAEAALQIEGVTHPDPMIWEDSEGHIETSAEEMCEYCGVDPYQREVFEHWIISDWLADKLEAEGEKVDRDFAGLTVWARTTTGQAIYADGVFERIAAALNAPSAEEMTARIRCFPTSDWEYEVGNGDTVLGYADWLEHKLEMAKAHPIAL